MFEMQRWDKVRRYRCSNLDDHIPNVRLCIKSKVSSYCYSRLQKGIGATARANRNVEARTSHTWHPREAPQTDSQPCQTTVLGINGTAALSSTSLPKPLLRSLGPPEEPRFCAIPSNPKCDRRTRFVPAYDLWTKQKPLTFSSKALATTPCTHRTFGRQFHMWVMLRMNPQLTASSQVERRWEVCYRCERAKLCYTIHGLPADIGAASLNMTCLRKQPCKKHLQV